jgi:hypothetical protein
MGIYTPAGLDPAAYTVTIAANGFKTVVRSGIMLETARELNLPVLMEAGQAGTGSQRQSHHLQFPLDATHNRLLNGWDSLLKQAFSDAAVARWRRLAATTRNFPAAPPAMVGGPMSATSRATSSSARATGSEAKNSAA